MVFLSQLLTVVNPKVTYHTNNGRAIHGIAINLKGFLHICDEYGIPHPDEKSIRSCMKKKLSQLCQAVFPSPKPHWPSKRYWCA